MSKSLNEDLMVPLLQVPKDPNNSDEQTTYHLISSGLQTISSTLIVITIWGNLNLVSRFSKIIGVFSSKSRKRSLFTRFSRFISWLSLLQSGRRKMSRIAGNYQILLYIIYSCCRLIGMTSGISGMIGAVMYCTSQYIGTKRFSELTTPDLLGNLSQ